MTRRDPPATASEPKPEPPAPPEKPRTPRKWAGLPTRFASGLVLVLLDFIVMAGGAPAIAATVLALSYGALFEFARIGADPTAALPLFVRHFPFLLYSVFLYFLAAGTRLPLIGALPSHARLHGLLCYAAGALLLVLFVAHLRPENLRPAYHRLWMAVFACAVIAVPAVQCAKLASLRIFWFFAATSAVVYNETAAYFCGRLFGGGRLVAFSSDQTIGGAIGGLIVATTACYFQPRLLARFPFAFCADAPALAFDVKCAIPDLFVEQRISAFGKWKWLAMPAQIHGVVLAFFASLIAPFAGLLASGLRRCFNIGRFGRVIPGHGGILDRMAGQLVMGSFALMYVRSSAVE
jgi:phosphatidate cytidylyltransferase